MRMLKLLITIPCHNEEVILRKNVALVTAYARNHFSEYAWKVLIIDNASQDRTWLIAQETQAADPEAIVVAQELEKGRGGALRRVWQRYPDFDIYAYMDADLSTDLKDFGILIAKVKQGKDLVFGSRYMTKSDVRRTPLRKFMSKIYNFLLRIILHVQFQDAQCGFKALSKRTVAGIVSQTTDSGWFWDTELIILAMRRGYSVEEIPVSWREIRDERRRSTVSPFMEAIKQLKNICQMRRRSNASPTPGPGRN